MFLNSPRWTKGLPRVVIVGRAGVGNLADVPHEERHALVELELVDGLVVGHVQEGLAVDF